MSEVNFLKKNELSGHLSNFIHTKYPISHYDLIGFMARRVADQSCPCSQNKLRNYIKDSLIDFFELSDAELDKKIDIVLEKFLILGDLIEVDNFLEFEDAEKGRLVFRPDPSFIFREQDRIAILIAFSTAVDYLSIYKDRIKSSQNIFYIKEIENEDLKSDLLENGLHEIKESDWLIPPPYIFNKRPIEIMRRYEEKLMGSPYSGQVEDLEILDDSRDPNFYKGRWVLPKNYSGIYLARRPSKFGAKGWGYAYIEGGILKKYIDFPCFSNSGRACDEAWQLLIFKDHLNSTPQTFRLELSDESTFIFFNSPLPSWVEKNLMLFGEKVFKPNMLFGYKVPNFHVISLVNKLKNQYFLKEGC